MLTDIYYFLKPILPWRLRIALRKWRGQRRRKTYATVWPIDQAAATAPAGWPGWPDGKQFALVLTHDVEGMKGFERIPRLMELTQKYGFRSSFYFVPKGEYRVDSRMRDRLNSAGFELGVHGLEHDGKLYRSNEAVRRYGRGDPESPSRIGGVRLPLATDAAQAGLDPPARKRI